MAEVVFEEHEVYSPDIEPARESFNSPKSREPLRTHKFVLLETPYIKHLRYITAKKFPQWLDVCRFLTSPDQTNRSGVSDGHLMQVYTLSGNFVHGSKYLTISLLTQFIAKENKS